MFLNDRHTHIVVGKVAGTFGTRGWLKVLSYTRPLTNIVHYRDWFLFRNSRMVKYTLLESKRHHKKTVILLDGVTSLAQAENLTGETIYVEKSAFGPSSTEHFLWLDLVGMMVIDQNGQSLGTVTQLFETGANDVLEVVSNSGTVVLIPFVMKEYIRQVDLNGRKIEVNWLS